MWVKNNQEKLRIELYNGLKDAVMRGDTTLAFVGKRFVLPSSFTRNPRYMIEITKMQWRSVDGLAT